MSRALKKLSAGELRFIGDLEVRDLGTDEAGSPLTTYSKFAENVYFAMSDWRATEAQQANTILGTFLTYVVIRWRPGLEGVAANVMRLRHPSDLSVSPPIVDYYDIQGCVRDPTTREALQLACIRRDSTGYRTGTIP